MKLFRFLWAMSEPLMFFGCFLFFSVLGIAGAIEGLGGASFVGFLGLVCLVPMFASYGQARESWEYDERCRAKRLRCQMPEHNGRILNVKDFPDGISFGDDVPVTASTDGCLMAEIPAGTLVTQALIDAIAATYKDVTLTREEVEKLIETA